MNPIYRNPIYKRESTVSSRSMRLVFTITACNAIMAAVALIYMSNILNQVNSTGEISYSAFINVFTFAATLEFAAILFVTPAMTSASICGERQRRTLDLLLTTQLTASDIVVGKLLSALLSVFLLAFSSAPILALIFVYGGVTLIDIGIIFFCFFSMAFLIGSIGIFMSVITNKPATATALSYAFIIIVMFGYNGLDYFVNVLKPDMTEINIPVHVANGVTGLLSPVSTFKLAIERLNRGTTVQIGFVKTAMSENSGNLNSMSRFFLGTGLQIILAFILIIVTVFVLRPHKATKRILPGK